MAKNLQERLLAAKGPRARIADNEALLADLEAEKARLEKARDRAAAESVDFLLAEDDRDEAAANAARLDRAIKGLSQEIAQVARLIDERRDDDARKAAEAERRAALTERDEIAARFAERVPTLVGEIISLLREVNANTGRMRAAGLHEANAEFKARGIGGNGMMGVSPVMEFAKMKIPDFASAGRAWPVDETSAIAASQMYDYADQKRQAQEAAE